MAKEKLKYDWKKTGKKFLFGLGYVGVCGLLYMVTGKPEVGFLVPFLIAAQNVLKHKLGWDWL